MRYLRYIFIYSAALLTANAAAQTAYDAAHLFTGHELNGTARYVAMGGAMGAFGNDISVIKSNPAGIGTYRTSDLNGSFSFSENRMTMTTGYHDDTDNFRTIQKGGTTTPYASFDNFSFVIASEAQKDLWINLGFSYRRTLKSKSTMFYQDEWSAPVDGDNYLFFRDHANHEKTFSNSYDVNLSFGYDNSLFWGVTMGVVDTRYDSDGYYYIYRPKASTVGRGTQYANSTLSDNVDYTSVDRLNHISAFGYDISAGVIWRVADFLHLGASVTSPTWYSVSQTYSDYLYAVKEDNKSGNLFEQKSDYKVVSPWVSRISIGFTVWNTALSWEKEFYYYSPAKILVGGHQMSDQCGPDFNNFGVVKFGLEHNIDKFSFRVGYQRANSIFKKDGTQYFGDTDFNSGRWDIESLKPVKTQNWCFGVGFCSAPNSEGSQFYVDAAYVKTRRISDFCANMYDDDPFVTYTQRAGRLMFTAGVYF